MKQSFKERVKKYKGRIIILLSGFAALILLIQNIKYFKNTVKEVFHEKKDDLLIIDSYILNDTLQLRVMNVGDKTIALRDAVVDVDTTIRINEESTVGIDFISATYGLQLDDSSKSYHSIVKLSQSLKPNESDRFAFKLQGGRIINYDSLRLIARDSFYYGAYFIQFKTRLFLNNTNESVSTDPMIHYFSKNNFYFARKRDTSGMREDEKKYYMRYYKNRETALQITKQKLYKSPAAISAIEHILSQ